MPADPLLALETVTMTAIVNKRNNPRLPLTSLMFGPNVSRISLLTETVQLDTLVGTYEMAPLVKKNGVAQTITRDTFNSETIETPCMKLKMPISYSDIFNQRLPGSANLAASRENDVIKENILRQQREDFDKMIRNIQRRFEWFVSNLIQGSVAYTNAKTGASFEITTAKPAANTFTVGTLWDQEAADIFEDNTTAARIITVDNFGPSPTIALCGKTAAATFRSRLNKGWVTAINTTSGIQAGNATLAQQFNELGMLFMGTIGTVEYWEVTGELTDDLGVTAPLIRDDYVEFIPFGDRGVADRKIYYGRHNSITAIEEGVDMEQMWARAWLDTDKDARFQEVQSRPMPWWEHPEWYVSMKVI